MFSIDGLRTVGFFLMRDHGIPAATAAMNLVAEAYPDSARAQKHLGDWYARGAVRDQARRIYETALAKLAADTSLSAEEKGRLAAEIREALANL
jgi:hypothetical protein